MENPRTSPAPALADENRREDWDRRTRPTGAWDSIRRGWARRGLARRGGETEDTYVDRYELKDVVLLVSVLILNVTDAYFTLRWLQLGGREANPLMNWLLGLGDWAFLVQKCIVVGIWLIILTVHKNFRIARFGLWSLLALYTGVLLYHFVLHSGIIGSAPNT